MTNNEKKVLPILLETLPQDHHKTINQQDHPQALIANGSVHAFSNFATNKIKKLPTTRTIIVRCRQLLLLFFNLLAEPGQLAAD